MKRAGRLPKSCSHGSACTSKCSLCRKVYQEKWRSKFNTPDRLRQYRLMHRFKLTPDQVVKMLKAQKNRCKLCREDFSTFVIDHDHSCCPGRISCGKCVRGLLCISCNAMLGQFGRILRIGIKNVLFYMGTRNAATI